MEKNGVLLIASGGRPLLRKINSVIRVHGRAILIERPPLVGEVGANSWG
jgi:hypothetical protein